MIVINKSICIRVKDVFERCSHTGISAMAYDAFQCQQVFYCGGKGNGLRPIKNREEFVGIHYTYDCSIGDLLNAWKSFNIKTLFDQGVEVIVDGKALTTSPAEEDENAAGSDLEADD